MLYIQRNNEPLICIDLFYRPLTPEQRELDSAVILFSVKDKDLFGMSNQYIAECYVSFNRVQPEDEDGNREQIHLKLTRPTLTGTNFSNRLSRDLLNC